MEVDADDEVLRDSGTEEEEAEEDGEEEEQGERNADLRYVLSV